jgi:hypothetical protein
MRALHIVPFVLRRAFEETEQRKPDASCDWLWKYNEEKRYRAYYNPEGGPSASEVNQVSIAPFK